jgi:hypothetical protein
MPNEILHFLCLISRDPQIDEDSMNNKACHGHSPLTASFPNSIYDSANVGDIEATPHSFKYIFKK